MIWSMYWTGEVGMIAGMLEREFESGPCEPLGLCSSEGVSDQMNDHEHPENDYF
jgi:hypothetical protein